MAETYFDDHDGLDSDLTERQRIAAQQRTADLRAVMGKPSGRRYIWGVLADLGIYRSTFNQDHAVMAFNEGMRNVGLKLTAELLRDAPDLYQLMTQENLNHE